MDILMGQSDTDNSMFYMITKGYEREYLKSNTFARLLSDGIFKEGRNWDYVLTDQAWEYIHLRRTTTVRR